MFALLLAIAAPLTALQTAVDAERAFAADAKTLGQWTAFRKWATDDAVIFQPQAVNARKALLQLKDPPRPVEWSPAKSFVSCDGSVAVNTGPTKWPDGRRGYFTTVWRKQANGAWRWIIDHGNAPAATKGRLDAAAEVIRASCAYIPARYVPSNTDRATVLARGWDAKTSDDGTLRWSWTVAPNGARLFRLMVWTGKLYTLLVDDQVGKLPASHQP